MKDCLLRILRWVLEFVAVIICGNIFVSVANTFYYCEGDFNVVIRLSFLVLYLAGIVWVAALRIVSAVKKRNSQRDTSE